MENMNILFWAGCAFLYGITVGSFLNVCIFRIPRNCLSIVRPRSTCPACRTLIAWYDNIPLCSYLFLGARCRTCRIPISYRYPLIEFLTGILFAYIIYHIGQRDAGIATSWNTFQIVIFFVFHAYLISAMLISTFIDFDFRIIPDEITLSGIPMIIILATSFPFIHDLLIPDLVRYADNVHLNACIRSVTGALCGGGIIYLVGVLGKIVFRKEAMGFGDVKYLAMLGAFLGWESIIIAFFLACFLGSFFGIIVSMITKDRYIAFGPYLSLGVLIMIFWNHEILILYHWYQGLFMITPAGML